MSIPGLNMPFPDLSQLIPVLQTSIGPVILISGVGLLLLSMTNRLGRIIDRARILREVTAKEDATMRREALAQLPILLSRADRIRKAIIFSTLSALMAAFLIITLFTAALFDFDAGWLVVLLFIACLLALIWSLLLFLKDVNQGLLALKLQLGNVLDDAP